jgi:Galactose oxidase, central domain/Kelch motif
MARWRTGALAGTLAATSVYRWLMAPSRRASPIRTFVAVATASACVSAACADAGGAKRPAPPPVKRTGSMALPRAAHSATLLKSGKVLIAGGCTLPGCDDIEGQTATAELYDPVTGKFTPTGSMGRIRVSQIGIRLDDGRVLLAGGYSGRDATGLLEIYDSATGGFRDAGTLLTARGDSTATRLRDGRILFAGGTDGRRVLDSAELYDQRTGQSTATGSMTTPRSIADATLLNDGRVLVVGGATTGGRVVASAEIYDPVSGKWTATGSLARVRYKHGIAKLRDGRVLVVGGAPEFDLGERYHETEIYQPKTGRFRAGPSSAYGRYHVVDAVLTLRSGRVLVAGDAPKLEVYDPARRRFRIAGTIGIGLSFSEVVELKSGNVLIVGGYESVSETPTRRAWIYRPSR